MEDKDINIKKDISDLFNKVSSVFDGNGPRFFAYFGEKMVEFASIKEGEKVLDIASGKGASLFPSVKRVGESGEVIGIDIADGMVYETNLEIQRRKIKNAKIMLMDAEKLQFECGTFDHVLCGFGVFFFPNYKVALDEFKRVLKNGGRCSFTTFLNKSDEKFIWFNKLVEKYLPNFEDESEEDDDSKFNTEEGLYKILNDSGFKNIMIKSEEKIFKYKDEQEWWDKLWTHGFRNVLEAMPKDKIDDFKSEVFENLKRIKRAEGIEAKMFVLYASGEKLSY